MTDPQDDVCCTACEVEGDSSRLDDDGLCCDCRTLAGRILTALAARGVKGNKIDGFAVKVGDLLVFSDPWSWAICRESDGDDHECNITSAATAIAAIVQLPGLRAERDTLAARVAMLEAELQKPVLDGWHWTNVRRNSQGEIAAAVRDSSWYALDEDGEPVARGPETGDAGKHAADLALVAAGYRLIGGIHFAPDEVSNGT